MYRYDRRRNQLRDASDRRNRGENKKKKTSVRFPCGSFNPLYLPLLPPFRPPPVDTQMRGSRQSYFVTANWFARSITTQFERLIPLQTACVAGRDVRTRVDTPFETFARTLIPRCPNSAALTKIRCNTKDKNSTYWYRCKILFLVKKNSLSFK